jgi:hypothetical protein
MEYIVKESVQQIQEVDREYKEDSTYRKLTQSTRDLSPIKQDKMIDISFYLYRRNALAKRYIDTMVNYVLSGGVKYKAEDKNVQKVLDAFWEHPINMWEVKQDQRIRDMYLTGEMIFKTEKDINTGVITLNLQDPKMVNELFSDPKNVEILKEITFKGDKKKYKIIHYDSSGNMDGEVFYFKINNISYQQRGVSELFALADWIDMHDKTMWSMAERIPFLLSFLWDWEIEEANEDQIRKKLEYLKRHPPYPGSFNVHSSREKMTAVSPDLAGRDFTDIMKLLKKQATGGLPAHFFGDIEDANRAGVREMSEPIEKELKNKQKIVKYIIKAMFDYQIIEAKKAGYIPSGSKEEYVIWMDPPSKKDTKAVAEVLTNVTNSLQTASMNKWLSNDTSRAVIINLLNELGHEIEKQVEDKQIEKEETDDPILDEIAKKVKGEDDGII